jgi:hypothetical protein
MAKLIKCPTCNNHNVYSIDNEPIYHPTKKEVDAGNMRYDNEIHIMFECLNCNEIFKKVFDIVAR